LFQSLFQSGYRAAGQRRRADGRAEHAPRKTLGRSCPVAGMCSSRTKQATMLRNLPTIKVYLPSGASHHTRYKEISALPTKVQTNILLRMRN
jgi:hypothetical protein